MLPSILKNISDQYMQIYSDDYHTGIVNMRNAGVGNSILVNSDLLLTELDRIDSKSDEELYELIRTGYPVLLDVEFINKMQNKVYIAKAFSNLRFVSAFCTMMSKVQLTELQSICCNKLIYDYMTSKNKNEMIVTQLFGLGWNINRNYITPLYGKGLDQNLITHLAIARNSTTDDTLAAKRVNVIIMNSPVNIMTEETIFSIYECFFCKSVRSLFNAIMFDSLDYIDEEDTEFAQEQEDIYATITLALLDMLNDLPMDMLCQLLKSYAQLKQYCHPNDKARFDIHSISGDYYRVLQAIEIVELEGVMVPHC